MPLRLSRAMARLCIIIYALIAVAVAQQQQNPAQAHNDHPTSHDSDAPEQNLVCLPFGICEPCPEDALSQPFCQPFGNRRLLHCRNSTSHAGGPSHPHTWTSHAGPPSQIAPQGEMLAWGACGKIVSKERADFFEFVVCNLFFALVALAVLVVRSRMVQAAQARQLAARIGLVRDTVRGWR
ncbi:hypothetical protein BD626DRAFT_439474 [Schizophyllum amplum]|uniref:Uncharacterized protein n=1 Tax=Schizophyllum amplum TaxID=97359 RepID=A0A550BY23_9AGAR|nr:hypothetical protein BD626DRAFT_439474 [Auriculariopsis ampla]